MSEFENGLITQIKEYLDDRTYNYAVLLNGGWGIGKTYFLLRLNIRLHFLKSSRISKNMLWKHNVNL